MHINARARTGRHTLTMDASTVLYGSAALIIGVAAAAAAAGVIRKWEGSMFSVLIYLLLASSVWYEASTKRVLENRPDSYIPSAGIDGAGGIIARIPLILTLCFALAVILGSIVNRVSNARSSLRQVPFNRAEASSDFVAAFFVFYLSFSVLPLAFGSATQFHVSLVYPFFIFLAVFLSVKVSVTDPTVTLKIAMSILVIGSLAAAVLFPRFSLQLGYQGLVPGFDYRLWGIAANANTLASAACALLILELAEPSKARWLRSAILLSSLIVLVLTQSKTAVAASAFAAASIFLWRVRLRIAGEMRSSVVQTSYTAASILSIVSALLAGLIIWTVLADSSISDLLRRQLNAGAIDDLETGTGRLWIWEVAISSFLENPLFGNGARFWSEEVRLRYGLNGGVHAHNQYLHALSCAGLIGLSSLLLFFGCLIAYSFRAAAATAGGSIGMTLTFFIRTLTEVPLQPNAILGAEFFAMMAYFLYVMDRGVKHDERKCTSTADGVRLAGEKLVRMQ